MGWWSEGGVGCGWGRARAAGARVDGIGPGHRRGNPSGRLEGDGCMAGEIKWARARRLCWAAGIALAFKAPPMWPLVGFLAQLYKAHICAFVCIIVIRSSSHFDDMRCVDQWSWDTACACVNLWQVDSCLFISWLSPESDYVLTVLHDV